MLNIDEKVLEEIVMESMRFMDPPNNLVKDTAISRAIDTKYGKREGTASDDLWYEYKQEAREKVNRILHENKEIGLGSKESKLKGQIRDAYFKQVRENTEQTPGDLEMARKYGLK